MATLGRYIIVRQGQYMLYDTLEEAEQEAKQYLKDCLDGGFSIAKIYEDMWIKHSYEILQEKLTEKEEVK